MNIPSESEIAKFTEAPASLELAKITKKFGEFTACEDVSLHVSPGSIHALLGENGAGKSTLVKCVMGYHSASSGDILVGGRSREIAHPSDARNYGIGMVYQHFTLVPSMTVTENLVLSRPDVPSIISWKVEKARLQEFMETEAPFQVPLDRRIDQLSAGEKQKTEILKQLYLRSRILILDEPTSVLTPGEATEVLTMLKKMTDAGKLSIIIITHKFHEVFAFADDVTVLRRGKLAGSGRVADFHRDALAGMMMGEAKDKPNRAETRACSVSGVQKERLKIHSLKAIGDNGVEAVCGVSLTLASGEIVGIAGVSGNGQRELHEVLAGQRQPSSGRVTVNGEDYYGSRREITKHRFHCLPEEPLRNACAPALSLAENLALRSFDQPPLKRFFGLLGNAAVRQAAMPLITQFNVKTRGPNTPIRDLSGGNVQRAVLARELATGGPEILAIAEPCFGLDFGAADFVHEQLIAARNRGVAVLVFSSDLDELLKISDRILVMSGGLITYETTPESADIATIGHHMAGHDSH